MANNKNKWSFEELNTLRQNYGHLDIFQLMELIPRSRQAIMQKAHDLGLAKDESAAPTDNDIDVSRNAYLTRSNGLDANQMLSVLKCYIATFSSVKEAADYLDTDIGKLRYMLRGQRCISKKILLELGFSWEAKKVYTYY